MVQPQRHKRKDGPPQPNNLAGEVAPLHAEEAGQADEPVAADGAQEDLVKGGHGLLLVDKVLHCGQEGVGVKDAAVSKDDCDEKERAGKVAKEAEDPV